MSENHKNTLKARTIKSWLRAWLIVVAVSSIIILTIAGLTKNLPGISWQWLFVIIATFIYSAVIATIFLGFWQFVRWLCCWHNFKRFLFGLVCFATLIALFYVEEDWRGKHDWDQFKHKWEAKGEKFDWQSVVPPPVPDDQNFAFSPVWIAQEKYQFQNAPKRAEAWYGNRIYSEAVSNIFSLFPVTELVGTNWNRMPQISDIGNWATARMTDLKSWQTFYRNFEMTNPAAEISITPQPQSPAQDVLLALSKFDPIFEELRRDSTRPDSRFPIQYDAENKAAILLPHLAALKQFAQVLQLRAIAELQNGESEKALDDVKLMLRLINAIRSEPFLISHLVRLAALQLTLQPIYEGLAEHKWSDSQLAALNAELQKLNFLTDYEFAMRGTLVMNIATIDSLHQEGPFQAWREVSNLFTGYNFYLPENDIFRFCLWPSGWLNQIKVQIARFFMQYYLPAVNVKNQSMSPAVIHKADQASESLCTISPFRNNFIERLILPPSSGAAVKFAYGQESVDLARVAIALERYRLAHGEYPESLDALSPQFMKTIPHDIIGGKPLHYRRTADGQFILYSVGWNETDDGGVVILRNDSSSNIDWDKGDWVWKYPQK